MLKIYLAGKNSILKDFIGFNDCQNSWLVVKRALKLLNKSYHYFTENKEKAKKHKEDKKQENSKDSHEVLMQFDVYTSKVQQNIDLLIRPVKFRNKYMLRIDKNIDVINKLLYEEKKEVQFIAKWMRIPLKIFVRSMKSYTKWVENKSFESRIRINNKIERFQNIKGLIEIYLGLNRGKCVNAKDILNFIQPWNL